MQDAMNYVNLAESFFKAGFAQVNLTLALVIVLYWAWRISDWSALLTTAIGAALMYLVALVLAPVVDHNAPLHLPPYQDSEYWRLVAALFLGATVTIGVLFFVKSLVMNWSSSLGESGGMMAAGAGHHGTSTHHDSGHDDHGHGGHDDHGHGGGHDDHGHGGGHGHDDHGHGGGGHGGGHH